MSPHFQTDLLGDVADEFAERLAAARAQTGLTPATDQLIPDPQLQRERYHCTEMTFNRWDTKPALGFPPPVRIGTRKHRWLSMLIAWERRCALARDDMAPMPPQRQSASRQGEMT